MSLPAIGRAVGGGRCSRPNPSSVSIGGSAASLAAATPWLVAAIRRSISTKRPESARLDQSALAVVWTSTIQPRPCFSAVTSGVPSTSRAQVLAARSISGSASTWRDTVTSAGIDSPANGLSGSKGASLAGCSHDSAPPMVRPPRRSRTGNSLSSCSARRGPAKRSNRPPAPTHLPTARASADESGPESGKISTASWRFSRSVADPRRISLNGPSARSR